MLHLPTCPRLSTPLSRQNPPKHPQISVFVLFTSIHALLTPPLSPVTPFSSCWSNSSLQIWIQTALRMPTAALSPSGCSHLCPASPVCSHTFVTLHLSQMSSLWSTGSASALLRGHPRCLPGAGMQGSPRGPAEV